MDTILWLHGTNYTVHNRVLALCTNIPWHYATTYKNKLQITLATLSVLLHITKKNYYFLQFFFLSPIEKKNIESSYASSGAQHILCLKKKKLDAGT
jgi:hypothetical protein